MGSGAVVGNDADKPAIVCTKIAGWDTRCMIRNGAGLISEPADWLTDDKLLTDCNVKKQTLETYFGQQNQIESTTTDVRTCSQT